MKKLLVERFRSRRIKAMSLIEISAALVVVGLMSAAIAVNLVEYTAQRKALTAAEKLTVVHEAANGYIKARYSELMSSTAGGTIVTVAAGREFIAEQPPVGSLQREGFLPPSFIDRNAFGQRHSLMVRQVTPVTGTGTPYLEAIVTTHGGLPIPEDQLGRVAGHVGVSGGYFGGYNINPADNGMIVGNFGGWRSPVLDWSTGGVGIDPGTVQTTLAFENGNLLLDYLYRNEVPGVPDANTMNTNINMDGNAINRVASLSGVEKDDAKYGLNPNVVTIDGDMDVIDVWGRNASLTGSLDVEGNVSVAGSAEFQSDVAVSGVLNAQDIQAKDITAEDVEMESANVTESLTAEKAVITELDLANVFLTMDPTTTDDTRFANGRRIKLRDLLPRTVALYSYQVTRDNNLVFKPVCGNGGDPKIMLYRQVESYLGEMSGSAPAIKSGIFATEDATKMFWEVKWEGDPHVGNIERTAIAQTFCSYQ